MTVFNPLVGAGSILWAPILSIPGAIVLYYILAQFREKMLKSASGILNKRIEIKGNTSTDGIISGVAGTAQTTVPNVKNLKWTYKTSDDILKPMSETLRRYGITNWEVKGVVSDISEMPLDPGVAGEYFPITHEILIDVSKGDVRSTVIHEVTHSVRMYTGKTALNMLRYPPRREGILVEHIEEPLTDMQAYRWFDDYHPSYLVWHRGEKFDSLVRRNYIVKSPVYDMFGLDGRSAINFMKESTDIPLYRRIISKGFRFLEILDKLAIPIILAYSGYVGVKDYLESRDYKYAAEKAGITATRDTLIYEVTSNLPTLAGAGIGIFFIVPVGLFEYDPMSPIKPLYSQEYMA